MNPNEMLQFTKNDRHIVRRALLRLPLEEQQVVFLRFWEEMSTEEIAIYFGHSYQKIESILARACEKIRTLCLMHPKFSRSMRQVSCSA
ncbi:MAG: hypothetical protein JST16_03765 [Bdellovibrionales bacterium]|nr:hypothetical protein [Bdellovibrionales bacterium]